MITKNHGTILRSITVLGGLALAVAGCAKATGDTSHDAQTALAGVTGFGAQCPYGNDAAPYAAELQLWNCPLKVGQVALTEPLEPLKFEVDCAKRTISVRNFRGTMDSPAWEFKPDGTFYLVLEKPAELVSAHLLTDGAGHSNCSAPLQMELMGDVECLDRDRATIHVRTVWHALKPLALQPGSAAPGSAAAGSCELPTSCYFSAEANVKQCM